MNDNLPHNIKNDTLARKVIRFLLIFQLIALLAVVIFTLTHISSLALIVAFITLVLFVGVILWLYIRFQTYPIVKEKKILGKQSSSLQAQIIAHTTNIQLTHQERERLQHAEHDEMSSALQRIQDNHIQEGLNNTRISEASIPGIGPKLKERLAYHGFITAKNVSPSISSVEGFGQAKSQAIIDWRNHVYSHFNSTKPSSLPSEISERIKQKYMVHHADNDSQERKIQESKKRLEKELEDLQPHLIRLSSVKFSNYLRYALSPQGIMAGIIASILIITQLCLGTSSTYGAIVNSIPTATLTPTITSTPTNTNTPTITNTPTVTNTPTITFTPSKTPTVTLTPTSTRSPTLTSTITFTPRPYIPPPPIYPPGATAICNDGIFSYSQHRRGTCSGHGGVREWLVNLPP